MDALFNLQATSGPKVNEEFYGARFIWSTFDFPCTFDGVLQNPPLMEGGFSPNTEVTVQVRSELFTDALPQKGHKCFLAINATESFALQIQTVTTSPGDLFLTFICMDSNQGA